MIEKCVYMYINFNQKFLTLGHQLKLYFNCTYALQAIFYGVGFCGQVRPEQYNVYHNQTYLVSWCISGQEGVMHLKWRSQKPQFLDHIFNIVRDIL